MNVSVFNDAKTTAGQVIEAAETFPFLSDKRFILVKDCGFFSEGKKDESDILGDYLKNLPDTVCIVFSEEKIDKRLKITKAAEKNGVAVEFKGLTESDLVRMLEKKFASNKIQAEKAVCINMVRTCGADPDKLSRETDKVIDYVRDKGSVTNDDIETICSASFETRVFDMIDAVIDGKKDRALKIYRNLILLNESPVMVLSLIERQFRIIMKCKSLAESGYSQTDMAKLAGVPPFVAKGALRQGRAYSYENIKDALNRCIDTDYKIKLGRLDMGMGVEMLIASL